MSMSKIKVYVAGPYTAGYVVENIRTAIVAANRLVDLGFAPYLPHLTGFWDLVCPRPYQDWLDLDNQFLPDCDVLLRLAGKSSGADKEVKLARQLGMPVFFAMAELEAFFAEGLAAARAEARKSRRPAKPRRTQVRDAMLRPGDRELASLVEANVESGTHRPARRRKRTGGGA